jgi:tetratricopeptide (TPR) repeat protein
LAQDAVRLDSRRATYWGSLGAALTADKKLAAANSAFAVAATLEPWQPSYWFDIGLTRLNLRDDLGARAGFKRAVEADPFYRDAWDLLARIAVNRGEFEAARIAGLRAVALGPDDESTYQAPIIADISLKRWDEAESLLKRALAHFDTPRLRVLRADVLANTGRRDEAIAILKAILAEQPENAEAKAALDRLQR